MGGTPRLKDGQRGEPWGVCEPSGHVLESSAHAWTFWVEKPEDRLEHTRPESPLGTCPSPSAPSPPNARRGSTARTGDHF